MATSYVSMVVVIVGSWCPGIYSQQFPNISEYYRWSPSDTRNDLYCPEICNGKPHDEEQECCACRSGQCWDIISPEKCGVTISYLYIEYIDIRGINKVITIPEERNSTFYRLIHQNGRLTAMPENLCDFPNTISVNLENNFIAILENVSCITELNALRLNQNHLTKLNSKTFSNLQKLRTLDISYNKLVSLEPYVFDTGNNLIFDVYATQETSVKVDVTNFYSSGFFCQRNFSNVQVEIVNESNFTVDGGPSIIGPGKVYTGVLTHTPLYNITDIGVSFPDLRRKLKIEHRFDQFSIYCDCSLVPYFKQLGHEDFVRFWPNFLGNAVCSGPETLSGLLLNDVFSNETLDKLVCNVIENCPWRCICTDYQNQGKVVVNCSGAGHTTLPDYMPTGYWNNRQLDVLLDHNDIGNAEPRDWLSRTKKLSFSRNPLERIEAAVVERLPNDAEIDLSGLLLTEITKSIQKKDLHKINFTDTSIICNCNNTWIGEWIRSKPAFKKLLCIVHGTSRFAEHVSSDTLGCFTENFFNTYLLSGIVALLAILLIIPVTLLHYFRYEILILNRRLFYNRKAQSKLFISFDFEDEWVFHWVIRDREHKHFHETILEELAIRNIACFIPYLDIALGGNVEEETSRMASKCTTSLVILSKGYLQNDLCRQEFDIIWTQYKENTDSNIIVIMFDSQNKLGINIDRRLKALLRAGNPLRFEAGNTRVLDRLLLKLEDPGQLTNKIKPCVDDTAKEQNMLRPLSFGKLPDTSRNIESKDIKETYCLEVQTVTNRECHMQDNHGSLSTDSSLNELNRTGQILAQGVLAKKFKKENKTIDRIENAASEKILCLSDNKTSRLNVKMPYFVDTENNEVKFESSSYVSGSTASLKYCLSPDDSSSAASQQQSAANIFPHHIHLESPSKCKQSLCRDRYVYSNKLQFRTQSAWFDNSQNMSVKNKRLTSETAARKARSNLLERLRNRNDRLLKRSVTRLNP